MQYAVIILAYCTKEIDVMPSFTLSEPTLLERIQTVLGLDTLQSEDELLEHIENRLSVNVIAALRKHGVSDAEIYCLVIPRRTLAHRKAKHEPLTREESDRAVRLARMTALAERVLGDKDKAQCWLHQPKRRFAGRTPLNMMNTETGARLVEEMLYQIDYGLFS